MTDQTTSLQTDDLRIQAIKNLIAPKVLQAEIPVGPNAASCIVQARDGIKKVLNDEDDRLVVVIGPCSIHDPEAAMEYGQRLLAEKQKLAEQLLIVMRVYFEKPRTTVGWKGLINDPGLDDSFEINRRFADRSWVCCETSMT